jgi:FkbM family methyltransferase
MSKILNYQLDIFSKDMKFNFYLNPKEYISSQILCYGLHEKNLLEFIFSILPKKYKRGICIDVGANIGNHSLFFSNYYDEIHAFEPVSSTFKALELNVLINGLFSKIKTYNIALSSINSRLRFFEDHSGDIGRSKIASQDEIKPKETIEYIIQTLKGDKYFSGSTNINIIKIDAEGHETNVIKGLSKSISLNHPIILFEANAIDHDSNVMIELKKMGYKYFYSPQIKYYDLKPSILKFLMRILFSSKFILVDIDEDFNYLSQLAIASYEELGSK